MTEKEFSEGLLNLIASTRGEISPERVVKRLLLSASGIYASNREHSELLFNAMSDAFAKTVDELRRKHRASQN